MNNEITEGTHHTVEIDETRYVRFSSDNWMQWMGESLEYPFLEAAYLEEQFQKQSKHKRPGKD